MYRKLAALVLAAALLCSCSARVTVQRYPAELPRAESPAATPTPEPVPTFTEEQKSYGSAALLTDATVLVNVFLNDAAHGHTWDAESRAAAVQRTQLAVDWITEQAAGYEAAVNLICDRSADGSDSTLTRSYLVQSAMQGGENSEESSAFLDEMDTLCASLAADSRLAAYGARHIAFLFFLPISGTSFTMAHYADDGDSFYYEYSCLYKTDAYTDGEAESPATYAHEILHLFGAPDLYEGSSDPYVDEALVSYVADTYPGDIMLSTYEDDGSSRFDAITKEIEYQELEIELAEKRLKEYSAGVKAKKLQLEEAENLSVERAADLAAKKAELEGIEAETAPLVAEYAAQGERVKEKIDERLLAAYDRIRRNVRNGLAVVTVKRDACGGCFNRIPPQRQVDIRQGKKIIICEYCGRILVADPDETQE
mgnify:CR=1 FL=1